MGRYVRIWWRSSGGRSEMGVEECCMATSDEAWSSTGEMTAVMRVPAWYSIRDHSSRVALYSMECRRDMR